MIRSRQGIKALGLLALALGLMAVFAGSATAARPAWMVAGADVNAVGAAVEVEEVEGGSASLLAVVGGVHIEILCTEALLNNVNLDKEGKLTHGKVTFHGCVTYINHELSEACEPYTELSGGVIDKGLVITNEGEGELALHEGETVTLLWPLNKTGAFVTIHLGEECAIGESIPVLGMLTLKDHNGEAEVENTRHLIEETLKSEEGGEGLYVYTVAEGHEAKINGSAWVRLAGEPAQKWSGLGP